MKPISVAQKLTELEHFKEISQNWCINLSILWIRKYQMFLGHFTSLKMSPQGENVTSGIFAQNPHALPNWPNVHCPLVRWVVWKLFFHYTRRSSCFIWVVGLFVFWQWMTNIEFHPPHNRMKYFIFQEYKLFQFQFGNFEYRIKNKCVKTL